MKVIAGNRSYLSHLPLASLGRLDVGQRSRGRPYDSFVLSLSLSLALIASYQVITCNTFKNLIIIFHSPTTAGNQLDLN